MNRWSEPLGQMGARIDTNEGGRPPLRIHGRQKLRGIDYKMPVASAQVKSSLLLAGLYAEGETVVTEPAPTRDHTERMLAGLGHAGGGGGGGGSRWRTCVCVAACLKASGSPRTRCRWRSTSSRHFLSRLPARRAKPC